VYDIYFPLLEVVAVGFDVAGEAPLGMCDRAKNKMRSHLTIDRSQLWGDLLHCGAKTHSVDWQLALHFHHWTLMIEDESFQQR
jgi:hypothetical protein